MLEVKIVRRWGGCRICCGCVAAAEPYQFCNVEKVGAVHGAMGHGTVAMARWNDCIRQSSICTLLKILFCGSRIEG